MRHLMLLVLGALGLASGQVLDVQSHATQTKLVVQASNTSPCTVKLSKSATLAPLVYDLDTALFTSASTGTVITGAGVAGRREILVGRRLAALNLSGRWDSRALPSNTLLFGEVSVCVASPLTFTTVTSVPRGAFPLGYPTDSAAWGQLALPEFDFTDLTKPVVDPQTGLEIYTFDPSLFSSNQALAIVSGFTLGGTGWTNPTNIINYAGAVAATTNTNPVTTLINTAAYTVQAYTGGNYYPYDNVLDIGLEVYGSGTDATGTNRTVRACLTLDSGQTCYTGYVTLVLPQTTDAAAGVMPSTYPKAYFGGWNKRLSRRKWVSGGYVTASAGAITLTKDDGGQTFFVNNRNTTAYFDPEWVSGTKIYIAGSSPTCTANLCTISSVTDGLHLTIMEALTLGESVYRAAALGVIISKTNSTGSVNVNARFRIAHGWGHDAWTGGCADTTVVSGDDITGYPCIFPGVRQEKGGLYFVGVSSPVVRLISVFPNVACAGCNAADSPNGATALFGPTTPAFDPIDPSYMYVTIATNSAGPALFKVHYTGTWGPLNMPPYSSNGYNAPGTGELTWVNQTRSEIGHDISTQVLANTTYNPTIFPALTGVLQAGYSNGLVFYTIQASGQDTAGWVFAFTASTGDFYKACNTFDGTCANALKYAGLHAGAPIEDGAILVSLHTLTSASSAYWLGGPFQSTPITVKKAGVFNANSSLPWPPDNGVYDTACPTGLENGTDGCVTMRLTDPCSLTPHAGEAAIYQCSDGNPAHSMIDQWRVGDWFNDYGYVLAMDTDSENFKIVQVTNLGGGTKEIVAWRNAAYSYCTIGVPPSRPDKDGFSTGRNTHADRWVVFAKPAEACASSTVLIDMALTFPTTGSVLNNKSLIGHYAIQKTATKKISIFGAGDESFGKVYHVLYNRDFNNLLTSADLFLPMNACFSGAGCSTLDTQSYADAKQRTAPVDLRSYIFDFRHFNGGSGAEIEAPNQGLGSATSATLQGGTTSVYKITPSGTVDLKRGNLTAWAGDQVPRDISSAATGNIVTDATPLRGCFSLRANECRTGSSPGDYYASIPGATLQTACWASQLNLRVPCVMTGPIQGTNAVQVLDSHPDQDGLFQRFLGHLLMGPGQQYVYSNLLPTPGGELFLFGCYEISGYHSGLCAAKLPPLGLDDVARNQYISVMAEGACTSCYIRFGYQEFGDPIGSSQFFCTSRAEECRVSASAIVQATPFKYAYETPTPATTTYKIAIPALPGMTLFWQVVDSGTPGPLQSSIIK